MIRVLLMDQSTGFQEYMRRHCRPDSQKQQRHYDPHAVHRGDHAASLA
jgi:hypothetical protein